LCCRKMFKINDLKISAKLIIGFFVIALIGGVIGYFGYTGSQRIFNDFDEIVDFTTPSIRALVEIKATAEEIEAEAISFALINAELEIAGGAAATATAAAEKEDLLEAIEEIEEWEAEYEKHITFGEEDELVFVKEIDDTSEKIEALALELVALKEQGVSGQKILDKKDELEVAERDFEVLIDKVIADEVVELEEADEDADKVAASTTTLILIITFAGFLLAIGLGTLISRSISRSVTRVRDTAVEIAQGNLNKRVEVISKDEIGQLAVAFNEMADKLEESYRGLEEKVATRTKELMASNKRLQEIAQKLTIARVELEESIAAKGEFMVIAAHELRTPLQPIIGYVNRLLSKSTLTKWQREKLNIVIESADRLLRLVQDILDINKMETRIMKFSFKEVNLLSLIKDVYETFKPLSKAKDLQFILDLPETLSTIRGDRGRLIQVFANLIDNSVRFTEKGSITISAKEDRDSVSVSVTDTGIGIAERDIGKLFTKFFQAEHYLQRKHEGAGLGLAIAKEIVKAHKGKISVESVLEKGTTFRVVLPKS